MVTTGPPNTTSLAERAGYTTIWTRDQWLHALALIPAKHALDVGKVDVIARFAGQMGATPAGAVLAMWPEQARG